MAVRDFNYLADIIPTILNNVDQPSSDAMGQTYENPGEIVRHCRLETDYLIGRISTLDEFYNVTIDNTISVSSGDAETTLPADCANLLEAYILGSNNKRHRSLHFSDQHQWDLHSAANTPVVVLDPTNNKLIWPAGAPDSYTLEIHYEAHLPPPVHGIVQDAGPSTIQFGDHELLDDDAYIGLNILIYSGTGAGQVRTVSDYDGVTRTATLSSAWTTTPEGVDQSNTSYYTSRPPLPREALNAFTEGLTMRLLGKLQEAVDMKRRPMLIEMLERMEESLTRKARKRVDVIRNDAGRTFHDPHEEVWAGYIPS